MKIQIKHTNRKDHYVSIPHSELVTIVGNEVRKFHPELPPTGGFDLIFNYDTANDVKAEVHWTQWIK